jgi:D-alanyl-D-alanine carboxypeptidase/D-alanyl-D-alanine-endopeptidase (penicillin-binding protein 4)
VLLETLAANGIAVDGGAKPAGAESDSRVWREIGRYESDLGTVAAVCNQRSQNLYAENLFRVLARSQGKPASFAGGASAVEQWLKAKRIPSSGLVVADGSGLARTNRVSAETLARVLALMDKGKEASVYRSTFAVSGESGTLDKRLGDDRTRGRVYAKTGTIRGVSSLSGYAVSLSGKRYAFSVIVNNYSGSARSAIDRFVIELVTGG